MIKDLKRFVIGSVLFMTLMLAFVVKVTHFHNSNGVSVSLLSDSKSGEYSEDCAICHFTVSPFTETTPVIFESIFEFNDIPFKPYICSVILTSSFSNGLRAPPVCLS